MDMCLFPPNLPKSDLIGCADIGYLSDPRNHWSQIRYLFTCGSKAISRRYVKQTIITTSSNYAKILARHKTSQ